MKTSEGGLYFGSGIDTAGLLSDSERIKREFKSIGQSAETETSRIDKSFRNIAGAAAGIFTVQAATGFITKIAQVRGEFQQLEVAFSTILKSKDKADKLMGEAVKLAAITPFTLQDVATGAKQLLAYGFGADSITKNLTMLGNVASGVSAPLGDIVYLYGTLQTQGRAYTRDIMQFTSRGIPMIDELSKVMGVGKEQVQGLVEAGKVGFPQVEKAMQNMTKEGGMFFNLMEEQSKTITGKISNLSDAFSRMYNDIGKSNQGIISGALDSTIDLVNNYQEVGKNIEALIVTFGAYKAALITLNAIQRATASAKYADEGASLMQLLTVEQKAIISKQNLTAGSAEHVAAVRAEAMAEMERQTQLAVTTQKEMLASAESLALKQKEQIAIQQNVAAKRLELETSIASLSSEKSVSIAKQISIASEIKSREALQLAMLKEREASAVIQLSALEQSNASATVIAAKRAEIIAIGEKITASKAEIAQQEQNIVAKRAEIVSIDGSIASKQVEKAQNAVNLAVQEANTVSIEKNALARTVSTEKSVIDSAVRRANTIETGINTAAQEANAAGTNILIFAKEKLIAVTARLNAFVMANPYVLIAAGVALLAFAVYKVATAMTEAEKAQKKLDEATNDYNASVITEQVEIETLFAKLNNAKKGTQEYDNAKKAIMSKYGTYLKGLGDEQHALDNVALAYKTITEEATKAAKARAMQNYSDQASKDLSDKMKTISEGIQSTLEDKYIKEFGERYGKKKAAQVFQQLAPYIAGRKDVDATISKLISTFDATFDVGTSITTGDWGVHNNLKDLLGQSKEATGVLKQTIEQATSIFGDVPEVKPIVPEKELTNLEKYNKQVQDARNNLANLKQKQDDLISLKVVPDNYAAEKEANIKAIAEAQSTLDNLLNKPTKKQSKDAEAEAEKRAKAQEESLKADQEFKRKQIDNAYNYEQERINLLDDSIQKEQDQNKLNYAKKLEDLKRQQEDQLEQLKKGAQAEFEAKGGKGIAPEVAKVTLPPESVALYKKMAETYKSQFDKADDDIFKVLLDKYKDFDQQRAEINKKYSADFEELISTNADGRNDAAIAKLNKDWEAALKSINIDQADSVVKSSGLFIKLFGDASKKSVSAIRKIADESKALFDYLKTTDPAKITDKKFGFTADELKAIQADPQLMMDMIDRINELNQTADEGESKFGSFGNAIKTLFNNIGKGKNTIENHKKATESLNSAYQDLTSFAGTAKDMLSAMSKQTGDSADQAAKDIEDTMSVASDTMKGFSQGGIIGAVVSFAVSVATKIFKAEKEHNEALAKIQAEKNAAQQEYNDLLLKQNEILDKAVTIFSKDVFDQAMGYSQQADKYAAILYAKAGKRVLAPTYDKFGYITGMGSTTEGATPGSIAALQDIRIKTDSGSNGFLGIGYKPEEYQLLLDMYPLLIDNQGKLNQAQAEAILNNQELDDTSKQALQSALNYSKEYDAAIKSLNDYLTSVFGSLGNDMMIAIVDNLGKSKDALDEFGKSASKTIGKLLEDIAFALFLADDFQKLSDDSKAIMDSATLSPAEKAAAEAKLMDDFAVSIGIDAAKANDWLQAWKKKNPDYFPESDKAQTAQSAASTGAAISTMSQESATALEGRFTALQMIGSDTLSIFKSIVPDIQAMRFNLDAMAGNGTVIAPVINVTSDISPSLSAIQVNTKITADTLKEQRNIALESMNHLADINKNTKQLYEMNERLANIQKGTDTLKG